MSAREKQLAKALEKLLRAYDSLLPGLAHIAVQDYALINEAPIDASKALDAIKTPVGARLQARRKLAG